MRPDDRVPPGDRVLRGEDDTVTTVGAARARVVLALVAWIVLAAISLGSLLYTTLAR